MPYSISSKKYEKVFAVRLSDGRWADKYDSNRLYLQKSAATKRANIINQEVHYWKPDGVVAEVVESKLDWVTSNS
jgi:hypothetical protein